jgi:membrane fusion protein, copper/silver efflux system
MKTKLPHVFALIIALVVVMALSALVGCGKSHSSDGAAAKKYHCPMHPTYVSDRPGDCPICGMKLVPIGDDKSGAGSSGQPSLPGRVTIHLAPEKRQLIGLTTSLVETQKLARVIRASATLSHDETTLTRVAPRFGGWVRKLHVNYTGQDVELGDPLFTAYSPELFSAESDYLIAWSGRQNQTNSTEAARLLGASRRRLELMQVGDTEIRALEERGQASDELLIRAPGSGHVLAKNAVEGKSFMAGESLYEIAPLHRLWVRAFVYEYELPEIKVGQKARVVFPNLGGTNYTSEVAFINPHLDPQTRRAEIRLELDNPGHVLKPDMWADVEIEANIGDVLAVPASAVINTGERDVAFVDRDDGHLEPREVKIGAKTDDYWQVLYGLKPGEKVVTRALFLVDSESQLKAAISGMGASGEHKH